MPSRAAPQRSRPFAVSRRLVPWAINNAVITEVRVGHARIDLPRVALRELAALFFSCTQPGRNFREPLYRCALSSRFIHLASKMMRLMTQHVHGNDLLEGGVALVAVYVVAQAIAGVALEPTDIRGAPDESNST